MKKTSQDFNIADKCFTVELRESGEEDITGYNNIVTLSVSGIDGYQVLQFNTFDKIDDATKQYNTIVSSLVGVNAALTKPLYDLETKRTHNHFWAWD